MRVFSPSAPSPCATPPSTANRARSSRTPLALPALPASAFHAIAEDELVARRAGELEAATCRPRHGQPHAGRLGRRRVGAAKAERTAANNPWVAESVKELRALAAQKDEVMFSKEAVFAARRMSTRLAASHESLSVQDATPAASYLRRKSSRAKRIRKPPQA